MDRTDDAAPQSPAAALSRRKWLRSLVVGGTLSAVGATVALVRTGGYDLSSDISNALRVLAPWQFVVMRAVARRMVATDGAQGVPSPDDVGVAVFIDDYLDGMAAPLRRDFLRLLRYVEHLAPIAAGFASRFTSLSAEEQDDVLRGLEASRFDQLRAGFQALKSMAMMGYYRDPRTFAILDYRGPLVPLPVEGAPAEGAP
jgi:hypothetical protein